MNKSELAAAVAEKTGLSKSMAEQVIGGVVDAITEELAKGGEIRLIGFGTFSTKKREARTGRDPKTGKSLAIPAKTVASFKPGKELKEAVA